MGDTLPTVDDVVAADPDISFDGEQLSILSQDSTVQVLPWPVCFLYAGRAAFSIMLNAPSPELALLTARQMADRFNQQAANFGHQPLMTAQGGFCPPSFG
ncbi:hypothetical protein [Streptomyces sp.]|uniref:hypothetical protein n=1 Tax=Streptomyces sp. TaxID=1931 RepID=UPI002D42E962|nr:hypothetical protein [Streptomyces sp.]HZF92663.1 hypothetical protein [Streptomyces sp.]